VGTAATFTGQARGAMDEQPQRPMNDGTVAPKEGPARPNPGDPQLGPNYEFLEKFYPDVVEAMRQLVSDFRYEGTVGRRHEIRRIKKSRLFWQGLQYNYGWDANEQEWQMPFGSTAGLSLSDDNDEEAGPRFEYVTNFYLAFGLSFIAVFSQDVPTVHWYPQSPQNEQDIATAKAAGEVADLALENNHVDELLQEVGKYLYVDGKLGAYVRYVSDASRFGFHENPIVEAQPQKMGDDAFVCPNCEAETPEGQMGAGMFCPQCGTPLGPQHFVEAPMINVPVVTGYKKIANAQEVITIVGGLELNTPVWANERHEMPYLQWQLEVHEAKLRAAYPDAADTILPGNPNDADDVYARASRVAVQQGLPTTHPGDALYSLITFTRNWIRPWAFHSQKVTKEVREQLMRLFPEGCYCAFAGNTYCESRSESMDDHWRTMNAMPGDGQNRPAIGDPVIPVQERYNELSNIQMEAAEYGYPPIFADPQVLDFDSLGDKDAQPGSYTPARAKPGRPLAEGFYQPNAASVPEDWVAYAQELKGPIAEFLTGILPAIFGGEMPTQETAAGYAQAREQAMGRLGLFWRRFKSFWAEVMELVVECFRNNRTEDVQRSVLREDGDYETKVISIADLRGNIQARPEPDETFPQLKSQQRALIQQLFVLAGESPEVAAMLNEPANMRQIRDTLALDDFVIPGEDSANKQGREIQQLLQGAPQQVMADAPDPQNPGQTMKMPKLISTIPVDPLLDRHQEEFEEGKRWANSQAGIEARMKNPAGFANVRAHLMQHQEAMAQPGQQKPPSESINFKDLPPSGKTQMAGQAGIHLDQEELEQKEADDKAQKAADMKAKFGNKKEKAA
jgi:hypothetical protein